MDAGSLVGNHERVEDARFQRYGVPEHEMSTKEHD
jgi:hypothetical protein